MSLKRFLADVAQGCGADVLTQERDALDRCAVDFWGRYRGVAAALLRPRATEDVAAIMKAAQRFRIPIVPQGGNTGLVAGGVPDGGGAQVVLSLARMNAVLAVDAADGSMTVEAGCPLDQARAAAAERGMQLPLRIGSSGSCAIGGNLATNAGGVEVLRHGMARRLALGLEVVLADGTIWDGLRSLRKDNTGYDLKQLFIGSEGTLGVITRCVLDIQPEDRERATAWLGVASPEAALAALDLARAELGPALTSFELISGPGVEAARARDVAPPIGPHPWHVLIEAAWPLAGGLEALVERLVEKVFAAGLARDGALAQSEAQRGAFWACRDGQSEAMRALGLVSRNDVSVAVAKTPRLIAAIDAALPAIAPAGAAFMPFGHMGDGNLHANIVLPPACPDAEAKATAISDQIARIAHDLGGSISAEHGVGRAKRALLEETKDPVARAMMRSLKDALDPAGVLNPGVIL